MTRQQLRKQQENIASTSNSSHNSTSSFGKVPYYGSREPKQSIIETDRVIFQMMDDMHIKPSTRDLEKQDEVSPKTTQTSVLWRFRIILSSILILVLVVGTFIQLFFIFKICYISIYYIKATVVVSEVTKEAS